MFRDFVSEGHWQIGKRKEEVRWGHCKQRKGKGQGNAMDVDDGVEEKGRGEEKIQAERGGFYGRDCVLSWHVPFRMVVYQLPEGKSLACLSNRVQHRKKSVSRVPAT